MSSRWSPDERLQLVARFQARSGAEGESFFDAHGLGAFYRRPGNGSSKQAKINSALYAAQGSGDLNAVWMLRWLISAIRHLLLSPNLI